MRLFTGFAGSQRVLTLNATDEQEAKAALTMMGVTGDGGLIIRRATPDETACWRASAMEAGTLCTHHGAYREKMADGPDA